MSEIQTENEQVDAAEDNNRIYNGITQLVAKTRQGTYDLFTKNVGVKVIGAGVGLAAMPFLGPASGAIAGALVANPLKNAAVKTYEWGKNTYSLGA